MPRAASRLSRVVVTGPLAPFAQAYRLELRRRRYAPRSAVNELRQVARHSRWLEDRKLLGPGQACEHKDAPVRRSPDFALILENRSLPVEAKAHATFASHDLARAHSTQDEEPTLLRLWRASIASPRTDVSSRHRTSDRHELRRSIHTRRDIGGCPSVSAER